MIRVRPISLKELPLILAEAVSFVEDSKHVPVDPMVFFQTWTKFIQTGIGTVFIMESPQDRPGVFRGGLGAVRMPDPNTGELTATEIFWHVKPEHRGHGLYLFKHFEKWARETGCTKVTVVHMADSMPDKLRRLYHRYGYRELETHYTKEIA